jgi:hypothetical protein
MPTSTSTYVGHLPRQPHGRYVQRPRFAARKVKAITALLSPASLDRIRTTEGATHNRFNDANRGK